MTAFESRRDFHRSVIQRQKTQERQDEIRIQCERERAERSLDHDD